MRLSLAASPHSSVVGWGEGGEESGSLRRPAGLSVGVMSSVVTGVSEYGFVRLTFFHSHGSLSAPAIGSIVRLLFALVPNCPTVI